MLEVLYKEDIIPIESYLRKEGADPQKWGAAPRCVACGSDLSPIMTAGFEETAPPPFMHKGADAGKTCPLSLKSDRKYGFLSKQLYDARSEGSVREKTESKKYGKLNGEVLQGLWGALVKRRLQGDEEFRIWSFARRKKLYNMPLLGAQPWLLPYFLVLALPPVSVDNGENAFDAFFKPNGQKKWSFSDYDGRQNTGTVPASIAVYVKYRGQRKFVPAKKPSHPFPLTEEAAYRVAGLTHEFSRSSLKLPRKQTQLGLF